MLRLSFLGAFDARLNGDTIREFESSKVRALLAYLALEADKPHSRDHLAGLFWGESSDETANKNLRQALSNLRKAIRDEDSDSPLLTVSSASIQADGQAGWLDTRAFASLLRACDSHPHRRLETCAACARRMEEALAHYRGGFLEGFFLKESEAFQDWIVIQREKFHQMATDALRALIAYHRRRGEFKPAIAHAQRLAALDPWREETHAALMELLARDDQRSAALKQYETCRSVLQKELGVEPQTETTRLYESIRASQLPPLETAATRNNLPADFTSFIGRARELSLLADRLQRTDSRLVTLTGLGGAGKTRLALQAAREQIHAFADGVFWVSLGGLANPEALPQAIAEAIGFVFASSGEPRAQLLNHLRQKETLLILDNFEHLLEGADFISTLLQTCPNLTLLVTSRESLRLQAEWIFDVGGLDASPADASTSLSTSFEPDSAPPASDSLRLFEARARQSLTNFVLTEDNLADVRDLCQLLNSLPLGIELAAASIRQFTPRQIAEQVRANLDFLSTSLRDVPERQRSLRAMFEYSWNMLSGEEKAGFAKLTVFPAAFHFQAAEQVCGVEHSMLNHLWQKSFVLQTAPGRYSLHPLLRQYGQGKLSDAESLEQSRRFQDYHADLASRLLTQLHGAELKTGLADFSEELENLVEAWRLALAETRLPPLHALLVPLFWFYEIRGRIYEGHDLFQKAAQFLEEKKRKKASASETNFAKRLSARLAWLAFRRSAVEDAAARLQVLAETELDAFKPDEQIFVLTRYASVLSEQGRGSEALKWFESALEVCSQTDAPWEEALACNNFGSVLNMLGDVERADNFLRRSLRIADEKGYVWISASVLTNLAVSAYFKVDYHAAIEMFTRSNEKALAYGDEHHSASINHNNLADCYLQLGETEKAREHLNLALFHFKECGNTVFLPYVYNTLAAIDIQSGRLDEARKNLKAGIRYALEYNMPPALNNLLAGLAEYYLLTGDETRSARLVQYILQSGDTNKEGRNHAAKLKNEIEKKFGADLWQQAGAIRKSAIQRELKDVLDEVTRKKG